MFCYNCGAKVEKPQTVNEEPSVNTVNSQAAPEEKKSYSSYAIASLIIGIVGLFFCGIILGILAIVFANIAKRHNGGARDGLSTAGFVLGIISLAVSAVIIIFVVSMITTVVYSSIFDAFSGIGLY